MRDDRIGGYSNGPSRHFASLGTSDAEWNITIGNRQKAVAQWNQTLFAFDQDIASAMEDPVEAAIVRATVEHGLLLHTVVEAGWRAMALVRIPGKEGCCHPLLRLGWNLEAGRSLITDSHSSTKL